MERTLADLIVADPEIMSGTPCFRGTRVPVYTLFEALADGMPLDEILRQWPSLNRADVVAVLTLTTETLTHAAAEAA